MTTEILTAVELLELFNGRRQSIASLLDLTKRQALAIEAGQYDDLLSLLNAKQRIIGQLESANGEMPRLQQNWHAVRDQAESGLRSKCEAVLDESERTLATLLQLEQDCTSTLAARQQQTKKQLSDISSGGQVHDAYRDPLATDTHRYLDIGQ